MHRQSVTYQLRPSWCGKHAQAISYTSVTDEIRQKNNKTIQAISYDRDFFDIHMQTISCTSVAVEIVAKKNEQAISYGRDCLEKHARAISYASVTVEIVWKIKYKQSVTHQLPSRYFRKTHTSNQLRYASVTVETAWKTHPTNQLRICYGRDSSENKRKQSITHELRSRSVQEQERRKSVTHQLRSRLPGKHTLAISYASVTSPCNQLRISYG